MVWFYYLWRIRWWTWLDCGKTDLICFSRQRDIIHEKRKTKESEFKTIIKSYVTIYAKSLWSEKPDKGEKKMGHLKIVSSLLLIVNLAHGLKINSVVVPKYAKVRININPQMIRRYIYITTMISIDLYQGGRIPFADLRLWHLSGPALQRQVVQGQHGIL